ncbi:sensor histidine kinase [Streptoalloteichus hindustanus]|uniref:sensor histidine kinase n=1 Tax=Streptoalloteichus hindustanus TaxID=2017 RepID=UPI000937F04D|nr:histidine kinase [Streptoalloteichus hindustanus]
MGGKRESGSGAPDRLRGLRAFTKWSLLAYGVVMPLMPALVMFSAPRVSAGWPADWPVGVAALVVFGALHGRLLMRGMEGYGHAHWRDRGILVAQAYSLAVWAAALALDASGGLWCTLPLAAAGAAAALLPRNQRWTQVVVMVALTAGLAVVGGYDLAGLLSVLFLAAALIWPAPMQVWLWDVGLQLDRARATEAELAVVKERLRFAADLHDILGHSLEVIALRAELATRLPDVDAARETMTEVRRTARDALREVREVVRGYRHADLATELTAVRSLLGSAGIHCRVTGEPRGLAAEHQAVLGLVLREAITNVLRHAQATECSISFETGGEETRLTVVNDGVSARADGGADSGGDGGPADGAADGTGLDGLAARLAAVGGRLRGGPEPGGRFRVCAAVPRTGEVAA